MMDRRVNAGPSRRARVVVAAFGMGAAFVFALASSCGPGAISDLTSGRRDAGADTAQKPDTSVCEHALPPDRPDSSEGVSIGDLLFAADDFRVDTGDVDAGIPKPESLDLDRTCSCLEPPSCVAPPDAGAPTCDESNGRDNVAGSLLGTLGALVPALKPTFLRERIHEGVYTILFAVQKWNGQPNDDSVLVNVRMSGGIDSERDPDTGLRAPPNFDGNDVWSVDPGSIIDGETLVGQDCTLVPCLGIGSDVRAYVRDGVLVAKFDNIPLSLSIGGGQILLPFVGAVLTARVTKDDSGVYRIAGELAGRLLTERLLLFASAFRDPVTNKSLCANPNTYEVFKKGVCESADLAADPAQDGTGKPCEALSEAVRFTGSPAKVGTVRKVEQDPSDCPDFKDSCR